MPLRVRLDFLTIILIRLSAPGRHRLGSSVITHVLPTSAAVDGVFELDFLRDPALTIDFRTGQITLA
jgi:hypothetical protein